MIAAMTMNDYFDIIPKIRDRTLKIKKKNGTFASYFKRGSLN
jgi:hypothetical protein